MAHSSRTIVETPFASVRGRTPDGTEPTVLRPTDAYAIASPPIDSASPGGNWSALSTIPMRVASVWEWALLAVLVLLVGGLVVIRIADVLSDRDFTPPVPASPTRDRGADDSNEHDRTYRGVVAADTPPELLSDEGRVVRLLVENDGRIRQFRIVEETDWSKSKVSRILSRMHEDGTIEKISLGRENVITLSETDEDARTRRVDDAFP